MKVFLVDVAKCNGCYNCFIACKDEYCGNDHPPYSLAQPLTGQFWMKIIEKEKSEVLYLIDYHAFYRWEI